MFVYLDNIQYSPKFGHTPYELDAFSFILMTVDIAASQPKASKLLPNLSLVYVFNLYLPSADASFRYTAVAARWAESECVKKTLRTKLPFCSSPLCVNVAVNRSALA